MADLITLQFGSVGSRPATNNPIDVAVIGAALVAIGPDRGGIFGVPLSIEGLTEAIRLFQTFQRLPGRDGRIDKGGSTLKRINAILFPGALPAPAPPSGPPGQPGELRLTSTEVLAGGAVWTPVEQSLMSDMVFKWGGIGSGGKIHFFEVGGNVSPNRFGILVPAGVENMQHVQLFFHPTPKQQNNPYDDAQYFTNPVWNNIFHYLRGEMAKQFCAAGSKQVLIMPLMRNDAANTCGMLPQQWDTLFSQALGLITGSPPVAIASMVVASFSSGITYSAAFRRLAKVGGRLRGIIDFDGIISTAKQHSQALATPAVRFWQSGVAAKQIPSLAATNFFPLPYNRWDPSGPYKFNAGSLLQIHGAIPQTMMFTAARRTSA